MGALGHRKLLNILPNISVHERKKTHVCCRDLESKSTNDITRNSQAVAHEYSESIAHRIPTFIALLTAYCSLRVGSSFARIVESDYILLNHDDPDRT
jgi:hypothetical protein